MTARILVAAFVLEMSISAQTNPPALPVQGTSAQSQAPAQPSSQAESLDQRMLSNSVSVYASIGDRAAGGFLLDPQHVATNLSACCSRNSAPEVASGNERITSRLVWSLKSSDAAILELDRPLKATGLTLTPSKLAREGEPAYAVLFGPSGEISIASGTIQDLGSAKDGSARTFRSNIPLTDGNAGGALFDGCGNVAAINLAGKDRQTEAGAVDAIIAGIVANGIPVRLAVQPCASTGGRFNMSWVQSGRWILGILLASALGFAVTRSVSGGKGMPTAPGDAYPAGAASMPPSSPPLPFSPPAPQVPPGAAQPLAQAPQASPPAPQALPDAPQPQVAPKPVLKGIAGQYNGKTVNLEVGSSTLGRDPQSANLVFGADADSVSKRHCSVRWDAARQVFMIEDHGSTNGTFLSTGERLPPNTPRELKPGDRFYIGDLRNQFQVILDM